MALIQFVQPGGGGTGVAGQAMIGLAALPVTIHNGDDSPLIKTSKFEFVDVPLGSAIPIGSAQDGTIKTYAFTPDIAGGYEVHLVTKDNNGIETEDYRVFQIAETSGLIIPPFGADASSLNFAGQKFGWKPYLNAYLKKIDALLTSPTVTGTVTHQLTRGRILSIPGELQTTDATVTTVASFAMLDESLCAFDVIVTAAMRTDIDKGGRWKRSVVYRRTDGGAPTIVGALEAGTDEETDAALDVTIDVSGNTVRVRVTGIAATLFNWTAELRVQETLAT